MQKRAGGFMSAEAVALISALCIVAIFFYAHYARQASWHDQEAKRLAAQVRPAVEGLFAQDPQAKLSPQALKDQGLAVPPPLQLAVTPFKDLRADWQAEVWHPQGQRVYLVGAQGIQDRPR